MHPSTAAAVQNTSEELPVCHKSTTVALALYPTPDRQPGTFGNDNNNDDEAPPKVNKKKEMADDRMEISDEEGSSLFASPTHPPTSRAHPPSQSQQQQQKTPVASSAAAAAATSNRDPSTNQSSSRLFGIDNTTIETREAALQRELEGVRKINQVIEGVISTLERAKGNMGVSFASFLRYPSSVYLRRFGSRVDHPFRLASLNFNHTSLRFNSSPLHPTSVQTPIQPHLPALLAHH